MDKRIVLCTVIVFICSIILAASIGYKIGFKQLTSAVSVVVDEKKDTICQKACGDAMEELLAVYNQGLADGYAMHRTPITDLWEWEVTDKWEEEAPRRLIKV